MNSQPSNYRNEFDVHKNIISYNNNSMRFFWSKRRKDQLKNNQNSELSRKRIGAVKVDEWSRKTESIVKEKPPKQQLLNSLIN